MKEQTKLEILVLDGDLAKERLKHRRIREALAFLQNEAADIEREVVKLLAEKATCRRILARLQKRKNRLVLGRN